jgi:membrane-anchored protein YejM (alkaline phosphatase superfamily)
MIWAFLQKPEQVEAIYSINLHYISIPIIFASEVFFSWLMWLKVRKISAKHIGLPIALFLFSMFALSHLLFIWADATDYRPITHQKAIYPLSYPMTARTFLIRQGWIVEEEVEESKLGLDPASQQEIRYPTEELTLTEATPLAQSNILIINIEALRSDMLNPTNMPNLQNLANEGLNFKNHFSGSNNSQQGVFSFFYGLPNSYWNTVTTHHTAPILIDKISASNRAMGLFSSIGLVQPEFLESSFSQLKFRSHVHYAKTENNEQVIQQSMRWITQQNKKASWFAYLYLEQKNSADFRDYGKKSIAEQGKDLSLYQSQVSTIDSQINQLISTLKKQKAFNNTVIIITGTHGQSFKGNDINIALINGSHVPMVMILPDHIPQEITKVTSHADIAPTLLKEIFSVSNNSHTYSIGQHLLSENEPPYVLSGDIDNYIIYEAEKITQFSRNGDINSIDWQGNYIEESQYDDDYDITLLIDVLSTLHRFDKK